MKHYSTQKTRRLALAFISLLGFLSSNVAAIASCPAGSNCFTQPIEIVNNGGVSLYAGFTTSDGATIFNYADVSGWRNQTTNQPCTLNGDYLQVPANQSCRASVQWPYGPGGRSFRLCATEQMGTGPAGEYSNCALAQRNLQTLVELGTGDATSSGVTYDITLIPLLVGADNIPCNDPQWGACPYVASTKTTPPGNPPGGPFYYSQVNPLQISSAERSPIVTTSFCSNVQSPAPYNLPVQVSCAGHKTFTCGGKPTLGALKFPDRCGFPNGLTLPGAHSNCSGNTPGCYQAFFWGMSTGSRTGNTGNGQYYCGNAGIQQPSDNCSPGNPDNLLTVNFGGSTLGAKRPNLIAILKWLLNFPFGGRVLLGSPPVPK